VYREEYRQSLKGYNLRKNCIESKKMLQENLPLKLRLSDGSKSLIIHELKKWRTAHLTFV
jgi:hypothetical protein